MSFEKNVRTILYQIDNTQRSGIKESFKVDWKFKIGEKIIVWIGFKSSLLPMPNIYFYVRPNTNVVRRFFFHSESKNK